MEMESENDEKIDDASLDTQERILKRCRLLPRRQAVQSKKLCAKDERNASLKKVNTEIKSFFINTL